MNSGKKWQTVAAVGTVVIAAFVAAKPGFAQAQQSAQTVAARDEAFQEDIQAAVIRQNPDYKEIPGAQPLEVDGQKLTLEATRRADDPDGNLYIVVRNPQKKIVYQNIDFN